MERKRTLKLSWDDPGICDDDEFFDPRDRLSCAAPMDLAMFGSDDSDDDEFEDSRLSLSSAAFGNSFRGGLDAPKSSSSIMEDYGLWMADPGDIKERRKRLLQGMGLASNKDLINKVASTKIARANSLKPPDPIKLKDKSSKSKKVRDANSKSLKILSKKDTPSKANRDAHLSPPPEKPKQNQNKAVVHKEKEKEPEVEETMEVEEDEEDEPTLPIFLVRSRSDGDIGSFSLDTKRRKEELIGPISKHRLTRTLSQTTYRKGIRQFSGPVIVARPKKRRHRSRSSQTSMSDECFGSFFLIKNLDTGKEFIVKECNEKGMWNKLSDLQTGKQLTMEEFEKHVGYSRMVKELMHRAHGRSNSKLNSYVSKSFRYSKKTSVALMKNLKGVANSMSMKISDKDPSLPPVNNKQPRQNSSAWIKVQQQGKTYKEFTGLQLCQEIQAHEGSIWTIKFSWDACYLASAGEDRVIHVWEVQDVEVIKPSDEQGGATPSHPSLKGKNSTKKKGDAIPDYVSMPESVFNLSEKPFCTLTGHQDEVLDLSWSKSQLLLSSSMDKTVRLWDIKTQSCLKMFAHNDYVTCIQFNPTDDDYFISGSLDAKVRIWNVPGRKVVDWTDMQKDIVSATSYTPDGEGVVIGLQKGICRMYRATDCKLGEEEQFDIEPKKKSQNKKITGFQFMGSNPSELLITSGDSYIRIHDGTNFTHKFRGFKITTSQIAASYSQDGKYVICASEDSQVYVWKKEEAKGKQPRCVTVQAHEHFPCKDVSVAISWPGTTKNELPPAVFEMSSKRAPSKRSSALPSAHPAPPTKDDSSAGTSNKKNLPPLPNKKSSVVERVPSQQLEDDQSDNQPGDSADSAAGANESFASGSPSVKYGDSPSHSRTPSDVPNATQGAWGMVIVTASSGGEIRVYQNFGLPVKANRQTDFANWNAFLQ